MMRELRKRMTLFLWVVAIAFILFIFLQWGMNISGTKGDRRNIDVIAKVNGISIKTRAYREKLTDIFNNLRDSQNLTYLEPLTERIIKENAYQELVQRAVLVDEITKNNIDVTNDEVKEIIRNSPPREILQDSSMYTHGKFDPQKYLQVLLNPSNRYFLYEQQMMIRKEYPIKKLTLMYAAGLKVTQPEVLKSYQEDSLKVKVAYLSFRVEDYLSKVSYTEQELTDYYAVHKEEYETSEGINLKTVMFEVEPSLTDKMEAKREIDDIYTLFEEGMNFDTLAMDYSQDGNTNQNGGDLGFIKRGELESEIEKVAFSLKEGDVSMPFQTSLGWHMLKVTDIKGSKRKISHILIKIIPGFETISGIKDKIDTFKTEAKEIGFEQTAKSFNLEVKKLLLYDEDGDLVPEIGKVIGINNFLFNKKRKESDIAGPFVGYDGNFFLLQLGTHLDTRLRELSEIREKIDEKVLREKAIELAKADAKQCFDEIKKGKNLTQAASLFSKHLRTTEYFSMKDFIPGVPYSSEFYGLAFTLKKGNVGLTSTKKGTFIITLLDRKDVKKEDFQKVSNTLLVNLIMKKNENILAYWFQKLRKDANIKDNRDLLDIY